MLVILVIIMKPLIGSARHRLANPAQQQMFEPVNTVVQIIRVFNELDLAINRSEKAIFQHLEALKWAHISSAAVCY